MRILTYCFAMCISTSFFAQKQDYTWVIGHDYNFNDNEYGRVVISFLDSPPSIEYFVGYENMNMFMTNVSISDTSGDLMFYSNGCNIANENGQIILNGNDLNPGEYHNTLCDEIGRGYTAGYPSAVILPLPGNDSIYYMFHGSVKYVPPPNEDAYVDRFLYSIIKVKGKKKTILTKNNPVIIDSLAFGEMSAVRHANGNDWWIILPRRNSNQFYVFLFTKDGIVDTLAQTIGDVPPANKEGYGQTTFSSDGNRMIRYFPYTDVMDFAFDRNNGHFTNYSTFSVDYGNDIAHQGGCAISPSGRYLYIAALLQIYQFDLWASDISSSQSKVAVWDGFIDPVAITFLTCQLGPDCKIYIVGGGDTRYYHIIHNPDKQGLACNVEQRGLVLPIPSGASIPYFPNYRLGPIDNPGLPCSPIVATNQPVISFKDDVRVWPNPASSQLSFAFSSSFHGKKCIRLFDMFGHLIKEVYLSVNSEDFTLSVNDMTPGLYFWEISCENGLSKRGRLIIH
jgi:hypothetical protein